MDFLNWLRPKKPSKIGPPFAPPVPRAEDNLKILQAATEFVASGQAESVAVAIYAKDGRLWHGWNGANANLYFAVAGLQKAMGERWFNSVEVKS